MDSKTHCTAFEGTRRIAAGALKDVAVRAKEVIDRGAQQALVLIFDDHTSHVIDLDYRGTPDDVVKRLTAPTAVPLQTESDEDKGRRPGRPKLGVVAREVTLLPRHWEWLNGQPGGASVALRKLVDEARNVTAGKDRVRVAKGAAYRFMSAMAGNEPGFEEAIRALFPRQSERVELMIATWPGDVRDHTRMLVSEALE